MWEKNISFRRLRDAVINELSQKALLQTDCSTTEIALKMGYSKPNTFTRLADMSPKAYRHSIRST